MSGEHKQWGFKELTIFYHELAGVSLSNPTARSPGPARSRRPATGARHRTSTGRIPMNCETGREVESPEHI